MPILAREPDQYPENLLERTDWTSDGEHHWWALYTRSRCEKELMRRLRALHIPHYGPLIEKKSRTPKGRTNTSFIPLFSNYVFLYGDTHQRLQALTTNCVSRDLVVHDGAQLAADLRELRQLIDSGEPIHAEPRLEPGTKVRVCTGPLTGREGIVVQRHGEAHLLVAVHFLQQGATVQIKDCQVEPI
ncbi:MAG: antitermination protein NusG [Planctomycetes bacterium]|nr:antitermination protein NusG [Planctomycetota bacterium]